MGNPTPSPSGPHRTALLRAPRFVNRALLGLIAAFAAFAAFAAPGASAAPTTAHFGIPSLAGANDLAGLDAAFGSQFSDGINADEPGCQVKGLGAFNAQLPSAAPGVAPGTYFYVVKAIGQPSGPAPFVCPPVLVGVPPVPGGAPAGTKNLNFLQWEATPGATSYEVYRAQLPASPTNPASYQRVNGPFAAAGVCPPTNPVPGGSYEARRCNFTDAGQFPVGAPVLADNFAPEETQAGSHPDFRMTQRIDYGGNNPNTAIGDTTIAEEPFSCGDPPVNAPCAGANPVAANEALRTDLFHFPFGLIANPRSTLSSPDPTEQGGPDAPVQVCERTGPNSLLGSETLHGRQDPDEDKCPLSTKVGTVETITRVPNSGPGNPTRLSKSFGDIYNGRTENGEAGRLFVVIRPACSAGHPQPFEPGGAVCTQLLGNAGFEVKKEFQAAVANLVDRGDQQYAIDVDVVDEITGGDIEPFQQILVPAGPGGAFVEPPNARIPRQVRVIQQDLWGYGSTAGSTGGQITHDVPGTDTPNVTLPTSCQTQSIIVDKTAHDTPNDVATSPAADGAFLTDGCANVPFEPGNVSEGRTEGSASSAQAESPFELAETVALCRAVDQQLRPIVDGCSAAGDDPIHQAHIRNITARFPRGLVVSAAAGNFVREGTQIADVSGFSDELGELRGNVQLGRVQNSPLNFRIEVEVRPVRPPVGAEPQTVIRFAALVTPNPETGQLVADFDNLPQVPFKWLELEFFGGERATLVSPPTNGEHSIHLELDPWSGQPQESVDDPFTTFGSEFSDAPLTRAIVGRPFDPNLTATTNPTTANQDASMTLRVANPDRHQNLGGFEMKLPDGLLAKLSAINPCPAAQADAGTCADVHQIGTVAISAGNGPTPLTLPGKVFAAEPLVAGDPLSLSVVVRAVAGPFDLGTVISRSRVQLEGARFGANVATVGNFPTILKGIPTRIRAIELTLQGLRTPPTCDPRAFVTTFTSTNDPTTEATAQEGGRTKTGETPYNATECENLSFTPKVAATVGAENDPASVGSHPPFSTVVTQPDNQAVIKDSKVSLPLGLNPNPAALSGICSPEEAAGRHCPESSNVGTASATSPLISEPLAGPMYLVENPGGLPKLVMFLDGLIPQRLEATNTLEGGRLVTTLGGLPATPVTRFALNINGGARGLFTVANQLCGGQNIDAAFGSHTGQAATDSAPVNVVGACIPVIEGSGTGNQPRVTIAIRNVRGTPRIQVTARSVRGQPRLRSLRVALPSSFPVLTRNVRRGVLVRAGGRRLARSQWSLSSRRILTIRNLRTARSVIQVNLRRGAIRASRSLRSRARGRAKIPQQTFSARVVDAANTRFDYRLRVRPRKR